LGSMRGALGGGPGGGRAGEKLKVESDEECVRKKLKGHDRFGGGAVGRKKPISLYEVKKP